MSAWKCLAAGLALFVVGACGEGPQPVGDVTGSAGLPSEPDYDRDSAAHADWIYFFESFPQLIASTDGVATGTVVAERAGEREGGGNDEIAFDHSYVSRTVTIEIDHVIYRADGAPELPGRIDIGDGGWEGDTPLYFNGIRWVRPGEQVFLFLRRSKGCDGPEWDAQPEIGRLPFRDGGFYGFDQRLMTQPIADELLDMSLEELRVRVKDKADRVDRSKRIPEVGVNCPK